MILVSACLAGIGCRYDGNSATESETVKLYRLGEAIALCPEELGGLPTPRMPAQLLNGIGEDVLDGKADVVREDGKIVTENYLIGAKAVLRIIKELGIKEARLKARSPSCGKDIVYKEGKTVSGNGVCAALLLREGIKVISGGC